MIPNLIPGYCIAVEKETSLAALWPSPSAPESPRPLQLRKEGIYVVKVDGTKISPGRVRNGGRDLIPSASRCSTKLENKEVE
ncbi:hypothetical protein O6P43_011350 [Quillaja saponaria]|uniref:Uncharacterized protein n=1 Tax=Quillaja saponaria TaxID=32244 RepID=A0AAD7Q2F7_QUISA|nr:hypothetical protein O6P43_011350 [Quillaja saponaria]